MTRSTSAVAAPSGTWGVRLTAEQARETGWLQIDRDAQVSPYALFAPWDRVGSARRIEVGAGCEVGAFSVLHGGVQVSSGARVEERVVVGQPEFGYALRQQHPGEGDTTTVGPSAVLRAGAVVYAGVTIGAASAIGHHTLLRTSARVARDCVLGHNLTIERGASIGDRVRASPGSHITADTVVGNDVFLGAGLRTVNDNVLDWAPGGGTGPIAPPRFADGARIGSGAVILGGVVIGPGALVGAGAVVLSDVAEHSTVVGNPARPLRARSRP